MNDISQIFNFNDSRPMTTHSLHKLTHKSFEKLGWMVLAIKYNDQDKINCYIERHGQSVHNKKKWNTWSTYGLELDTSITEEETE